MADVGETDGLELEILGEVWNVGGCPVEELTVVDAAVEVPSVASVVADDGLWIRGE